MKVDCQICISRPQGNDGSYIEIRLIDVNSRARFFEGRMSLEDFAECLTGLSNRPISGEVRGLENVGKLRVVERRVAECPFSSCSREEMSAWLIANKQEEGWQLDPYLGSQSSMSHGKDKTILRYSVYRYEPIPEEPKLP